MYESYFGLNKKAFQITTDPNFLWMGSKHREALSTLKYGVMDNKGFLLLTGDVGTGKTTLINRLVGDLKDKAYTAKIPDPRLSKYDFYRMVNRYFKLPIEVRTKSDFIEPFSRFLNDAHKERKSVLLLIDEAQRLKHDLMEEIRLLSNLERQDAKLLNIFFVGQNEFNSTLLRPENRALMRRITITYNIDPLSKGETGDYIRHRLNVAGADHEIFSAGAVEEAYDFSNGFPRQINIICDLAMFFAAQLKQRTISRKVVRQCRERISFSLDEPPAERHAGVRLPVASSPTFGHAHRRQWSVPLRSAAVLAAASLVLGAGVYFAPDHWKSSARQWIIQRLMTDEQPAAIPVDAFRSDTPAPMPPAAGIKPVNPAATLGSPETATIPDLPLRTPRQPRDIDFTESGKVRFDPSPTGQPTLGEVPPPSDLTAPAKQQPDPAAAVDWVLKKRRQNKTDP